MYNLLHVACRSLKLLSHNIFKSTVWLIITIVCKSFSFFVPFPIFFVSVLLNLLLLRNSRSGTVTSIICGSCFVIYVPTCKETVTTDTSSISGEVYSNNCTIYNCFVCQVKAKYDWSRDVWNFFLVSCNEVTL